MSNFGHLRGFQPTMESNDATLEWSRPCSGFKWSLLSSLTYRRFDPIVTFMATEEGGCVHCEIITCNLCAKYDVVSGGQYFFFLEVIIRRYSTATENIIRRYCTAAEDIIRRYLL